MKNQEEKTLKIATVVFLLRNKGSGPDNEEICLAVKARHIGKGCRNGYGGGVESYDKTIETGAIRELKKESGIQKASPEDLEKVAVCFFKNTKSDGTVFTCKVHIYILRVWKGEPKESQEMLRPKWYKASKLPFGKMMLADKVWVPRILAGEKIKVKASYGPFQKTLIGKVSVRKIAKKELNSV